MAMVVYLDIILLLNFLIDTLLLWFTAFFRKERIVRWRIAAAAAVGSAYVAFFFFPSFAGLYQWAVKLLFSVVMLWIAFGFRRLYSFLQNLCVFYFVAFVFGGGVFALTYLTSSQREVVNGILITHSDGFGAGVKPTFAVLAAGFALVYVLSRKSYGAIQEPRRLESFLADVAVRVAGESVLCRGLVDTGNQLHDPLTRTPVMVMESRLFAHVLPPPLTALLERDRDDLTRWDGLFDELASDWQGRVRLIPFATVSRGIDFLVAIKPDHVVIQQQGTRYEGRDVLIGLRPDPLSIDRKYQAIVHPALLQVAAEGDIPSREQEG